jgi:hypothetical protein
MGPTYKNTMKRNNDPPPRRPASTRDIYAQNLREGVTSYSLRIER